MAFFQYDFDSGRIFVEESVNQEFVDGFCLRARHVMFILQP